MAADLQVGGDQPFVRRIVGVSVCTQVGSLYNEGTWKKLVKAWVGQAQKRTLERNKQWARDFQEGGKGSVECKGCTGVVVLSVGGSNICLCCLHLSMGMGRLLKDFVKGRARRLTPPEQQEVNRILRAGKTGLRVQGSQTPDGEEGYRLFQVWPQLVPVLGCTVAEDAAITGMRNLLRDLYVTFLPTVLPKCREAAQAFRRVVAPQSMSNYLFFLEEDADWLLEELRKRGPYGFAMFSGDVLETFNRLLKVAFNDHSNRGAQWEAGEVGALEALGDVLRQVMEWVFLWFHVPLTQGVGHRNKPKCRAQDLCEGKIRIPSRPPQPESEPASPPPTPAGPGTPVPPVPPSTRPLSSRRSPRTINPGSPIPLGTIRQLFSSAPLGTSPRGGARSHHGRPASTPATRCSPRMGAAVPPAAGSSSCAAPGLPPSLSPPLRLSLPLSLPLGLSAPLSLPLGLPPPLPPPLSQAAAQAAQAAQAAADAAAQASLVLPSAHSCSSPIFFCCKCRTFVVGGGGVCVCLGGGVCVFWPLCLIFHLLSFVACSLNIIYIQHACNIRATCLQHAALAPRSFAHMLQYVADMLFIIQMLYVVPYVAKPPFILFFFPP